jgi:alkanesulfonate monooxygenase SsuD/methylene tetrahydromethanopterin reductase-like flavin-dependent oxidoreductase (luciferase family)
VSSRPRLGVWLYPGVSALQLVEAVRIAEACGLDEVWIADEGVAREPLTILAAAALLTTRITLAVGITSPLLRHPGALAATAATLDELSEGRALLGLGLGGTESLGPFGITSPRPITAMSSAIRICRGVFESRTVEGYEPPSHAMEPRAVPIWIGARGPQMIKLAAQRADGVFISGCTKEQVDAIVAGVEMHSEPSSPRPCGLALYHSASDVIVADSVSTWDRAAADLAELAAQHHVTSIGVNVVDLSLPSPPEARLLVERAAKVLTSAASLLSNGAAR